MCKKNSIYVLILFLAFLIGISCTPRTSRIPTNPPTNTAIPTSTAIAANTASSTSAPNAMSTSQFEIGIKFLEEFYDFGIKDEGTIVQHDYIFTNTGKQTIEILDAKPTCSCTTVNSWDKTVAPGEKGKISISVDTTGFQGDLTKIVLVTTNILQRKTIVLTIKVNVKTPLAIIPKNVYLGEILPGYNKPLSGNFEIENNETAPLKIVEVIAPDNKTKFTLTTIEKGKKYKVIFTVDPPFEGEETVSKKFKIKTDSANYPEIIPSYSYYIMPAIQVEPAKVEISLDQLKEFVIPFMTSINVRSLIDKPIQIRDLKLIGGKGLKYEIIEAARNKIYQILITVPLNYVHNKDEKISFTFSVLNDPKNKKYKIPVIFF